ncbi:MAG: 2-oxoacid:acceptor oxidoreductase family protein [Erysipelothrix sp.]|jgi:2-oxoglutarate ferredoxin oxidoreductase subunit gamma|nr:2-oxoacid:acceptor oxidoreductase family protein [Erysipelothrix sp.]
MKPTIKLICAGFGGQGVLSVGQLIGMCGIELGYDVSWMPSYGPEMRGGTANCHVVLSNIGQSPFIGKDMTHALLMNDAAFNKFKSFIKDDTSIVIHTGLIHQDYPGCDFSTLAHEHGVDKSMNMIAFGMLVRSLGWDEHLGYKVMKSKFKGLSESLHTDNEKAFKLGFTYESV